MTSYELIVNDETQRLCDNCYVHKKVMYYVSDEEFERVLFELRLELEIYNRINGPKSRHYHS